MGSRGREKLVRCEKCGRQVRKDKALYIDKVMLSNPLERNQVQDEHYARVITREVCYCISCGKHNRLFEKKKLQQAQTKARGDYLSQYGARPPAANQYSTQRNMSDRPERAPRKERPPEGLQPQGDEPAKEAEGEATATGKESQPTGNE